MSEADPSVVDDTIEPARGKAVASEVDDVSIADPWHSRLDHSAIDEAESGLTISGYDLHGNMIGQISIAGAGQDILEITHRYPRQCAQEYPGSEDCADVLHATVHLGEGWDDAWANAPAALFSDRATALAAKLPPGTEEGRLFCALSVAAASAACASIALSGPIGAPGCAVSSLVALCKCDTFHKAFPNVDWDELCN